MNDAESADLFGRRVPVPARGAGRQLPLPLAWGGARQATGRFIPAAVNDEAVRHVLGWREWSAPASLLVGPARSGRSTLAQLFVASGGGVVVDPLSGADEEAVFHAWNRAAGGEARLLVVAHSVAEIDALHLPDLRTRLSSAPVATIGSPDACLTRDLVDHLLAERGLVPAPNLGGYVAARIERSYVAIHAAVDAIDRAALSSGSGATIRTARAALIAASLYDPAAGDADSPATEW